MAIVSSVSELTTLATLKVELGIDPGDTSKDAYLTELIKRRSAEIESYLDRTLGYQVDWVLEENLDNRRFNEAIIFLDIYPLDSITSVVVGGVTLDPTDYYISKDSGLMTFTTLGLRTLSESLITTAEGNIVVMVVTYTGGYALPASTDPVRDLPYDIEGAVLGLCKLGYYSRTQNPIVKSEQVPDVLSMTYFGVDAGANASAAMLEAVDGYRDLRAL